MPAKASVGTGSGRARVTGGPLESRSGTNYGAIAPHTACTACSYCAVTDCQRLVVFFFILFCVFVFMVLGISLMFILGKYSIQLCLIPYFHFIYSLKTWAFFKLYGHTLMGDREFKTLMCLCNFTLS